MRKERPSECPNLNEAGTNEELVCLALEAEAEAGDFYRYLAAGFSHVPAVRAFWEEMRRDEEVHLEELRRIHQTLAPEVLAAPTDPEIFLKARRIAEFGLLKKARRIGNLEEAYQLAHQLENSEIMTVFSFIREKFVPLIDQRSFTLSVLEEHLDRIMNFPRRFGDAPNRGTISFRGRLG